MLKSSVFDYYSNTVDVSVEFSVNEFVFKEVSMALRAMGDSDSMLDRLFPLNPITVRKQWVTFQSRRLSKSRPVI